MESTISCEVEIVEEYNTKHRRKLTAAYIRCSRHWTIVGPIWGTSLPLLVLEGTAELDDICSCGFWHEADSIYREEISQLRERLLVLDDLLQSANKEEAVTISQEYMNVEAQIEEIKKENLPWIVKSTKPCGGQEPTL